MPGLYVTFGKNVHERRGYGLENVFAQRGSFMAVKVFQGLDQPGLGRDHMIVFEVVQQVLKLIYKGTCLLV